MSRGKQNRFRIKRHARTTLPTIKTQENADFHGDPVYSDWEFLGWDDNEDHMEGYWECRICNAKEYGHHDEANLEDCYCLAEDHPNVDEVEELWEFNSNVNDEDGEGYYKCANCQVIAEGYNSHREAPYSGDCNCLAADE